MSSTLATDRPAARRFRPGLWLTLLATSSFALLCALGTWQVSRLQWKLGLIEAMERGFAQPPIELEGVVDPKSLASFGRVRVVGTWRAGEPLFLGLEARSGEVGSKLVDILVDGRGRAWIVDRGWIPDRLQAAAKAGSFGGKEQVSFEAMVREPLGRGSFTPANDMVAGRIYSEDTILAADPTLMPKILVAASPTGPLQDRHPVPTPLRLDVKNDHLGYALTWYGLAASLLVFYVLMGFQRGAGEPP